MFTSSGGIGIPLCAEQQYLYDISYDDDWSLCKHEDEGSCFIHVSPSSMGLPERHFICDIPQLTPVFPTNASSSSAEPAVAHSFLHTHRKKPLKKDRHSKILTAQGTRDRRMRLSLDIAKQFFYLQDLLGFDKASKTVEWLLNQSEASIKELEKIKSKGSPQNSEKSDPTSDGEVASGIEDVILENNPKEIEKPSPVFKEKKMNLCRKRIFDPLARESRAKARQWAKQRTLLKKNFDESNKLTSANAQETADGIGSHSMESFSSIYNFDYNENIQISQRMNTENLSSNQTSSYLNPNYHLSSETSQDRLLSFPFSPTLTTHFTDLPLCSKPWEVFSN